MSDKKEKRKSFLFKSLGTLRREAKERKEQKESKAVADTIQNKDEYNKYKTSEGIRSSSEMPNAIEPQSQPRNEAPTGKVEKNIGQIEEKKDKGKSRMSIRFGKKEKQIPTEEKPENPTPNKSREDLIVALNDLERPDTPERPETPGKKEKDSTAVDRPTTPREASIKPTTPRETSEALNTEESSSSTIKKKNRMSMILRKSSDAAPAEPTVSIPKTNEQLLTEAIEKCKGGGSYFLDISGLKVAVVPPVLMSMGATLIKADMSFNEIEDFPSFSTFTELLELNLDGNQITKLNSSVGQLIRLKSLSINGNKIKMLPPELMHLKNLEKLSVANNALESLVKHSCDRSYIKPMEIGYLEKLEEANFSGNALTTLPQEIAHLKSLETLDLSGSNLVQLPNEIAFCTKLLDLNLGNNKLSELPWTIGRLTRLCNLNLSDNMLTDIPVSLGHCISLGRIGSGIFLDRNPISSAEMMQQYRLGADRLLHFLEERLKIAGGRPSWEELKALQPPRFKTYTEIEAERKFREKGFINDISTNPELHQKAVLLRGWAKNQLAQIKTYLQDKHVAFMSASTLETATLRSDPLKIMCQQIEAGSEFLNPSNDPPKGLVECRTSDTEIIKYTKEIDNMVRTMKQTLQKFESTVEQSDSSKQLIGIVQCLKNVKIN